MPTPAMSLRPWDGKFLVLALSCITAAFAQGGNQPLVQETATRVSDHVWAILGFPNVVIVTGTRATLVVDTGLGPRNGATVARVVHRLSNNPRLYLTTTHFHPEHAGGDAGFPADTILVRPAVQQQELEQHGQEMVATFSRMSAQNKELLADVQFRPPDIVFTSEATLDLGGVSARLFWLGPAHTKGDELIFVEPDSLWRDFSCSAPPSGSCNSGISTAVFNYSVNQQ